LLYRTDSASEKAINVLRENRTARAGAARGRRRHRTGGRRRLSGTPRCAAETGRYI
jgi:hypothetical protein